MTLAMVPEVLSMASDALDRGITFDDCVHGRDWGCDCSWITNAAAVLISGKLAWTCGCKFGCALGGSGCSCRCGCGCGCDCSEGFGVIEIVLIAACSCASGVSSGCGGRGCEEGFC